MKNFYFKAILFCFCSLMSANAFADPVEIDGIYYNLITKSKQAAVTTRYGGYGGSVIIPETVTHNGATYNVTSIGGSAFQSCSSLTSITIPNSVTSIGGSAFQYCYSLTSITIPNSVTSIGASAFNECTGLVSISIPESVTSIGGGAFDRTPWYDNQSDGMIYIGNVAYKFKGEMSEGTQIVLREGTIGVSGSAFKSCINLISITIPNGVTSIGAQAFYECTGLTSISFPESVTSIGAQAFENCSGLTSISFPESVTSLGERAFDGTPWYDNQSDGMIYIGKVAYKYKGEMPEGTQIVLKEGTTEISWLAFSRCTGLISISIPESVTSIGAGAFNGCTGLASISIPKSVTSIGQQAFLNCTGLTLVNFGCTLTMYYHGIEGIFRGCNNIKFLILDCEVVNNILFGSSRLTIQSVTLGDHVKTIDSEAFQFCPSLTSVNFSNSATSIGDYAFYGCGNLISLTIPDSVTNVGKFAFHETPWYNVQPEGLVYAGRVAYRYKGTMPEGTRLVFKDSTLGIANYAFSDCSALISVTIPESIVYIGENSFSSCKTRDILIKRKTPPISFMNSFSDQTYLHTTLYVPIGCWDAYAYDDNWYKFHNIRETALAEEEVSEQQAYTLMDANTFVYSVYDPVNDCIGTINSAGSINEDNPNHSWQMIEAGGAHYLYNIGAKKYVRRNGNGYELTDTPTAIDVEDGENGLILGAQTDKQWALVSNESMSVNQAIITGVPSMEDGSKTEEGAIYNLAGQRLSKMQKGINIVGGKKIAC